MGVRQFTFNRNRTLFCTPHEGLLHKLFLSITDYFLKFRFTGTTSQRKPGPMPVTTQHSLRGGAGARPRGRAAWAPELPGQWLLWSTPCTPTAASPARGSPPGPCACYKSDSSLICRTSSKSSLQTHVFSFRNHRSVPHG